MYTIFVNYTSVKMRVKRSWCYYIELHVGYSLAKCILYHIFKESVNAKEYIWRYYKLEELCSTFSEICSIEKIQENHLSKGYKISWSLLTGETLVHVYCPSATHSCAPATYLLAHNSSKRAFKTTHLITYFTFNYRF